MPVHSTGEPVNAANSPAAEPLLLTIGRTGVLSCRAIGAEELDGLLRLLGPPSERQRESIKRATDIVLIESGAILLLVPHRRALPHQRRRLCHGACASHTRRMNTAALKRELALLRSSLAALKPSQSTTLDDFVAWAEGIAELTLDPWQRDVLLSVSPLRRGGTTSEPSIKRLPTTTLRAARRA